METRQLECFVAVAEYMHFTKAAQAIHISQPALSQQILKLEEEVGTKLLERTKRHVQLTPAGIAFRERAESALQQIAEAASHAQMVARGEAGLIRVAFVSTATIEILPKILNKFCKRFPQVTVELVHLDPAEQLGAIERGNFSVGLTSISSPLPYLDRKLLVREKLVVALPHRHPAASQRTVDLKELSKDRFLLPPRSGLSGVHQGILQACQRSGFVPRHVQTVKTAETAVFLVAGNTGIALVPASFRRLNVTGVVYRPLRHEVPSIEIFAIRRKEHDSPLVDSFWEVAVSMAHKTTSAEN